MHPHSVSCFQVKYNMVELNQQICFSVLRCLTRSCKSYEAAANVSEGYFVKRVRCKSYGTTDDVAQSPPSRLTTLLFRVRARLDSMETATGMS